MIQFEVCCEPWGVMSEAGMMPELTERFIMMDMYQASHLTLLGMLELVFPYAAIKCVGRFAWS